MNQKRQKKGAVTHVYTHFLRAATGNALTTVRAGRALTWTTFPKTSRLPALVAGLTRVLTKHTPGMVKRPFLTSSAATSARVASILLAWLRDTSAAPARTSAISVFDIGLPAFPPLPAAFI